MAKLSIYVVHARTLTVAPKPELSGTTVHVLKFKRDKAHRLHPFAPELGEAVTKSLCNLASLRLAIGTTVIVLGEVHRQPASYVLVMYQPFAERLLVIACGCLITHGGLPGAERSEGRG